MCRHPWDGCAAPPLETDCARYPLDIFLQLATPGNGAPIGIYRGHVPGVAPLRSLPLAVPCNPFGVNTGDGPLVLKSMLFGPREIGKYSPQSGNCTAQLTFRPSVSGKDGGGG